MTDRDKKSGRDRKGEANEESIIPGKHGKHGGSMESEGSPQEPQPEAQVPPRGNGADQHRH